jgi:colanic acid biosynthesis glycosyl transferase WcaI
MRILLLNQFFWPDTAATSQFLTDLARGLEERGHDVFVICAGGDSYAVEDRSQPPGAKVHRVKSLQFVHNSIGRLLSYASFFVGSAFKGLRVPRPDVVLSLTTPPLLSLIGTLIQSVRGSRHFIWEMDVYPDVATDLEYVSPGGLVERIIGVLADFSRRRSDGILALGSCMKDRLLRRKIAEDKIHITENWADSSAIKPAAWPSHRERLILLYSGNLGLAHDTDTIVGAMKIFKRDTKFRFVFAGGGPRRQQLETWCREQEIESAEFRSYSQRVDLGASLGSGHIGLVTQRAACLGSVVPSKFYGLLAAGRPVLFIGPRESTVAKAINRFKCGWHIECGDVEGLARLLNELECDRTKIVEAGRRARQALLDHYDLELGVSRICELLGASSGESVAALALSAAVSR